LFSWFKGRVFSTGAIEKKRHSLVFNVFVSNGLSGFFIRLFSWFKGPGFQGGVIEKKRHLHFQRCKIKGLVRGQSW